MDPDLQPRRADESLGQLAREASQQASTLIRDEVALAKKELSDDITQAVLGISLFTVAGVTTFLAVVMLSIAAGFGVGLLLGEDWTWAGFALVGAGYLLIAAISGAVGKKATDEIGPPVPRAERQAKRTATAARTIGR